MTTQDPRHAQRVHEANLADYHDTLDRREITFLCLLLIVAVPVVWAGLRLVGMVWN